MYRALLTAAFAIASISASTGASACTFPIRHHNRDEIRRMAAQAYAQATTVVDGEVVVPMALDQNLPDGALPVAYIKVTHTWKGHVEDGIAPVAYVSSCNLGLESKGQKVRILLQGEGIFTADQSANGSEAVDEGDAFNREIDRLVGAPRPVDFTNPGGPPPPEKP